ncbi:unnamed protein product [Blepharisma stoltei]|uniref:Sec16 Sec23-binding domain-containing protein n=1 Tax=Blepharisma stoltei TaxID=1481888 RepID=A0AAU9JWB3_9CILI|nr:unnamed protein product [Blepharisma stoltei]
MFALHLEGKGCMAWEDQNLLATGADHLELHYLDRNEFKYIYTLQPRSPISCLEWSKHGDGFLAGGSKRGTLSFWKKNELLSDPSRSFIKEEKILESVPVTTIQFCPSKQNLLAVGASDVFILNVDGLNKQDPSQYIYKLGSSNEGVALAAFSWNPQVQHILAAASMNGMATVWDLRQNRTLFNVCDQAYLNKAACSSLMWNPEIPTQFIMAYDDAKIPALQIWDLRKSDVPVKEFKKNHKNGITSMAWCPHDSGIFASSDRAGFSVIWDFKRGENLSIVEHHVNSDVVSLKWVPGKYGVLAAGGEDGSIEVRSIYDTGVKEPNEKVHTTSDDPKTETKKPGTNHTPKWLLRKVGSAIGFKDKIAVYNQNSNSVHLSALSIKNKELEESCSVLHKLYLQDNWKEISKYYIENHHMPAEEKLQWEIISSKFSKDQSSLLASLDLNKKDIIQETEIFTGKKRETEETTTNRKQSFQDSVSFAELSALDAQNFFDKVVATHAPEKVSSPQKRTQEIDYSRVINETISRNINWNEAGEKLIKDNLIIKNLESAIDCALMCGRSAEALIIAEHGGPELFKRTKNAVISSSKDLFLKTTFLALLNGKIEEIIPTFEIGRWKEILAIIISHGENNVNELALSLAARLEEENMLEAAYACMAVAGNFNKLVESWISQTSRVIAGDRKKYASQVQYLFFKASALAASNRSLSDNKLLENIEYEYLQLLYSSGLYQEADEIIKKLPSVKHCMNLLVLLDRVTKNATGNSRAPWQVANVVPVTQKRKTIEQSIPKTKETKHDPFPVPVSRTSPPYSEAPIRKGSIPDPPHPKVVNAPIHPPPPQPVKNQAFQGSMVPPPPIEPKTSPFGKTHASPFPVTREEVPPPPVGIMTSPFGNQGNVHSDTHSGETIAPPPPPPVIKQTIPPPPIARPNPPPPPVINTPVKEPEVIPRPPVFQPVLTQQEVPVKTPNFQQMGQQYEAAKEPPPIVKAQAPIPHAVSVPRPPVRTPGAFKPPERKVETKQAEGIDLSGIPNNLMPIARFWADAIQQPSITQTSRLYKDVESRMQDFFNKLKNQEFNESIMQLIQQMTTAFESGDIKTAMGAHLSLTNASWNENSNWLMGAKRIMQATQPKQ